MPKGIPQEILHKEFAKEFVANGLNATQAYKKVKPKATIGTARVEASRALTNPNVRSEITKLLEENELDLKSAITTHKRNMLQDKQLGVSQTAVQDVYKLYGLHNQDKTPVNIGVFIKQ